MASASATLAGKAKSARCGTTSAKFPTATDTDTVSMENALVSEDTKESSAETSIVPTLPVLATVSASKGPASAKKGGKASIARQWTRTRCNVCQTAPDMERSMSIRKLVRVTRGGQGKIVLKVIFIAHFKL